MFRGENHVIYGQKLVKNHKNLNHSRAPMPAGLIPLQWIEQPLTMPNQQKNWCPWRVPEKI